MKPVPLSFVLFLIVAAAVAAPWSSHGPVGGVVTQLAVAATDHNVIYVIAPDSVFRTRDAGATWSNISGPVASPRGLVVSNASPDSVVVSAASGVFRSDDGGATWVRGGAGLPAAIASGRLIADPRDPNVLYLSSNDCYHTLAAAGVFKSTDGGRSFSTANDGLNQYERCITGLMLDPLNPERLYSSWAFQDISGVSRSDDGGKQWRAVHGPSPERGVVVGLAASQQRYAIGYAGFSLLAGADGVSWSSTVIQAGIEDGPVLATRFNTLALDPVAGRLFLGATNGAYRSGNGGVTWIRLGGAALDPINSLDFDTTSGALIIGTDYGLFRSQGFPWNDWSDLHIGNAAMPVGQVIADPSNGDVYALSARHLFRSRDLGRSWERVGDPLSNPFSTITIDAGHQLYSSDYRDGSYHLQKLSPEGHWEEIRKVGTFSGLVADPREAGRLYSLELQALAHTRDGGATWERLALPSSASSLSIDPRNTSVMIAATFEGLIKSVDGGHTWMTIDVPQYWARFWIVRAPSNPDVMYMYARDSFAFVVARSTDGGQTWSTTPTQPAANDGIGRIAVDPRDADTIYAPTLNNGVVRSTDGGRTWQSINAGLPENHGASLAIDSRGAFLHAGTVNRGVWELPLPAGRRRPAAK